MSPGFWVRILALGGVSLGSSKIVTLSSSFPQVTVDLVAAGVLIALLAVTAFLERRPRPLESGPDGHDLPAFALMVGGGLLLWFSPSQTVLWSGVGALLMVAALATGLSGRTFGEGLLLGLSLGLPGLTLLLGLPGPWVATAALVGALVALALVFVGKPPKPAAEVEPTPIPPGLLSDREAEVARLLMVGHLNKEIAALLGISLSTVKTHVANLYDKLGAKNRVEAVRKLQSHTKG